MKNIREAVHDVIEHRILPWIERDGISKLLLPEQITPEHCAKPIKCKHSERIWHREHEIGIGLVGEAPYCIDGKRFIIAPGRMVLMPAGTPHTSDQTTFRYSEDIDPNRPASSLWLSVYPFGLRVQVSHIIVEKNVIEANPSYMLLDWHFSHLMANLLEEVRSRQSDYAGIGQGILIEFMHRCLRASSVTSPLTAPVHRWPAGSPSAKGSRRKVTKAASKQMPSRVQNAQDFIHSHYHTFITVDDVAAAADSSVTHLSRLFKAATGTTLIAYLANIRMEAAKALLRTDLKILDVARLVGIENAHYFSRLFSRINGVSPIAYRREMVKNPNSTRPSTKSHKVE